MKHDPRVIESRGGRAKGRLGYWYLLGVFRLASAHTVHTHTRAHRHAHTMHTHARTHSARTHACTHIHTARTHTRTHSARTCAHTQCKHMRTHIHTVEAHGKNCRLTQICRHGASPHAKMREKPGKPVGAPGKPVGAPGKTSRGARASRCGILKENSLEGLWD